MCLEGKCSGKSPVTQSSFQSQTASHACKNDMQYTVWPAGGAIRRVIETWSARAAVRKWLCLCGQNMGVFFSWDYIFNLGVRKRAKKRKYNSQRGPRQLLSGGRASRLMLRHTPSARELIEGESDREQGKEGETLHEDSQEVAKIWLL